MSTQPSPQSTATYDVVVLGAGIAGLTAAATAVESGLTVAVLEKTDSFGGSSAMSGGFFAFSGTPEQEAEGIQDTAEAFRDDLVRLGGGHADPALIDTYLEHQDDTYAWLKEHGVVFGAVEVSSGQSHARSHLSPIKDVLAELARTVVEHGGVILTGHRATELVTDGGGSVTGVRAVGPQGPTQFAGRGGVIIASGGFSRGEDLLRVFAPEQLAGIPYGGLGNTGDGLKMAWKLGAGLADMSFISGTFGSHPETGIEFHELLTANYMGAIIVNTAGRRFVDESLSYKTLGAACLAQPDGLGFEVFDASVRARSHPGVPLNDIGFLEDLGHVYTADTLEGLAAAAGIDAAGLIETVAAYNRAVAGEEPDAFGRTGLVNGTGDLVPVLQAPFYAYPAKTLMTSTYCGLTITPEARVKDVDGRVIEGLFAVGEVTGGFHGAAYMTGTSLGKGAVFGRIAARAIAAALIPVS
ncbi:FAD-dependent oxidoreductase [Sinomonas flava]|uniref:FAD-dependent oxidoreductase n=1 Tax=Sinomonas flava TaxID=496857 RepID=UPI0039A56B35